MPSRSLRAAIVASAALAAVLLVPATVSLAVPDGTRQAADLPGPTDVLHVPMSWCILNGSPAQAAPNILSEGAAAPDTNTDGVIWRRHERPTDNIYLPQATISLRSEINNAWGAAFDFPFLNDTDTTRGQVGDVNGWNVNTDGAEFTALINNCDAAYATPALGRAGIGVTAVNVNLFHDNANPANDGNAQMDYVGIIGWGGCNEFPAGTCAAPYDGRIMVIDNHFLYPTVPDRTFPPSPADPAGNLQFVLTDPLDQLVGHEVGHALSLDHRTSGTALMNPGQTDSNADGRTDNIGLNAAEVTSTRTNGNTVPGLEVDPPAVFTPGSVLAMRVPDRGRNRRLAAYRDLASLRAALNTRSGRFYLGQQLWGLNPCRAGDTTTYATLADLDGRAATGITAAQARKLGVPTAFAGSELLVRSAVGGGAKQGPFGRCQVKTTAFVVRDGKLVALAPAAYRVTIQTLRVHPHFSPIRGQRFQPRDFAADVYHTIQLDVANAALPVRVRPGRAFRANGVVVVAGKPADALGEGDGGARFVLQSPRFAHCFPAGPGRPGGTIDVRFDGLRPNTPIHALLGPNLVLDGIPTDANGSGRIALPIPRGTRPGLHLVTIGHDGIALTADCTAMVEG